MKAIELPGLGPREVPILCECQREAEAVWEERWRWLQRMTEMEPILRKFRPPQNLRKANFESFRDREGTMAARKAMVAYAYTLAGYRKPSPSGIYLYGRPGCGKSHLAAAVYNVVTKARGFCAYVSAPEFVAELRDLIRSDEGSEQELFHGLLRCDLIILDDLGAENLTGFTQSSLHRLIAGCEENQVPLLVTGNLHLMDLGRRLDARTIDRLRGMCLVVHNSAESYRGVEES